MVKSGSSGCTALQGSLLEKTLEGSESAKGLRVMEKKYKLGERKLYKLFKIGNWCGILYFAFIHIGICMLPVVFNAGMEATGDMAVSIGMVLRVLKSIAVPLAVGFIGRDLCVTIAWIGMVQGDGEPDMTRMYDTGCERGIRQYGIG